MKKEKLFTFEQWKSVYHAEIERAYEQGRSAYGDLVGFKSDYEQTWYDLYVEYAPRGMWSAHQHIGV